jgi:hypothetical protein
MTRNARMKDRSSMSKTRDEKMAPQLHLDRATGAFDLVEPGSGDGWQGLQFYLRCKDGEYVAKAPGGYQRRAGKTSWQAELMPDIEVTFEAAPSPRGGGVCVRPSLANHGRTPLRFIGYGFRPAERAAGPRISGHGLPVFAHSENLRYERLPHSRPTYPLVRPLPETGGWYGRQGVGPIPALILGRQNQDRWLVEGQASQERHASSWFLGLTTVPGRLLDYHSEFFWNGSSEEEVAPGQKVALESNLYLLVEASPDCFYDAYLAELVELYGDRFAGPHSHLATEPVYCTWNYGIYTGLTEVDCLKRIKIAGDTQRKGIFQLDHGYQPPHKPHASWGYMDAYYPDTAATWDKTRFPGGPKRFVEACRTRNLLPAIWWTPRMDIGGPISQEHPDWIAVNKEGRPIEHVGDLHPDYSVPAVRQFIQQTIRTVVHEWGFGGIKLDFFSWAFDAPDLVYRYGGTSVQWRRWLLGMVRKELGRTGYFLHCVSCPLGNPFLALDGCDSFRAGIDIDRGTWEHHVTDCAWMLASFPAVGRQTWFADMDSFMGSPEFPGNERRFRCAVGYLTSGMIDISGPLEKFDAAMLREYRRLSERCDQGCKVLVPDRAAFTGRPLPRVLVRLHDAGSKTRREHGVLATVGLFNWEPSAQDIAVSLAELGLRDGTLRARDFWTGRRMPLRDGVVAARLKPREHLIIDISR